MRGNSFSLLIALGKQFLINYHNQL